MAVCLIVTTDRGKLTIGVMESSLISLCFCTQILFSAPVVSSGALIVTPQNLVVMSGQRVEIQCQTDNGKKLKWFSQRPGSSNEEQIYSGFDFLSHAAHLYTICNSSDGKQSICFNALVDTARRYKCLEPGSLEVGSAEVIVLESNPECNATRDDEYLNITCAIGFRGNWIPEMDWMWCNNNTPFIGDVSSSISPNDHLSITLAVRLNFNNSGACFRLTTMLNETERPWGTTANNTPSYNHAICFKEPDWNNTFDCTEAQPDESSENSTMPTETDANHTIIILTAITTISIGIFGFVFCWVVYRSRKKYDAISNDATGSPMLRSKTRPNYSKNKNSRIPRSPS